MNSHSRIMSDAEMLEIAMEELDKAHEDISRLLRLHTANAAAVSVLLDKNAGGRTSDAKITKLTSRFGGLNALTHHMAEKNYDRAFIWASALRKRLKDHAPFVRALRDLQGKRGEISDALLLTVRSSTPGPKSRRERGKKAGGKISRALRLDPNHSWPECSN